MTKQKAKELSRRLEPTNENLIEAYYFLCQLNAVKPAKIKFKKFKKGLGKTQFKYFNFWGFKFFKRFKIRISRHSDWLYILFHEFAHQLRLLDQQDKEHSIEFYRIFNYILSNYYWSVYIHTFKYGSF